MRNLTTIALSALFLSAPLCQADNQFPVKVVGVTYNGLHATNNPSSQVVAQELTGIAQKFDYVRTYYEKYEGSDKRISLPAAAKAANVKLLVGLYIYDRKDWTDGDYETYLKGPLETSNAQPAGSRDIGGVLIGNENIAQRAEIERLIGVVRKDAPNIPISTAQENAVWLGEFASLVNKVDFIAANIYPTWCWTGNSANGMPAATCGNTTPITPELAFNSFVNQFNELKQRYPTKQIVVTETGYPTNYGNNVGLGSVLAKSYACQYVQRVSNWARDNNQTVFIYEMIDSNNSVSAKSQFNYNFGIQNKFSIPSFKNNFPNMNCPVV